MRALTPSAIITGAIAAGLWLASGLVNMLAGSSVYVARVLRIVVPSPTNSLFWLWPMPWSLLALVLAALVMMALVGLFSVLLARSRGGAGFAGLWLATIGAGAAVGLMLDGINVLSAVGVVGWRAITMTTIDYAVVGAYWGLVQGWIPAWIGSRWAVRDASHRPAAKHVTRIAIVAAVVIALFVGAGVAGAAANAKAIAEAAAIADGFTPEDGAAPDRAAPGSPPPTVASTPVDRDPSWCTPEQAMPLIGMDDAATGHRALSIRMMNFSDEACVVEGYPDVAFADQNGNELHVTIEHGSTFMAQDPGAQPVQIPAGGYAIVYIGWDANSMNGALVARSLFAAQAAGDVRGSWPVDLDIVDGSTVSVTAWAVDEAVPSADGDG